MTPQQIMDLPYAGMAEKQLRKQKNWDEYAGLPEQEYQVKVDYEIIEVASDYVLVKARHEDEAGEMAIDEIESDYDVVNGSADVLEVTALEGE
jgi:hypothetical protein